MICRNITHSGYELVIFCHVFHVLFDKLGATTVLIGPIEHGCEQMRTWIFFCNLTVQIVMDLFKSRMFVQVNWATLIKNIYTFPNFLTNLKWKAPLPPVVLFVFHQDCSIM